jgi:putative Mg2+ transporter-C (MgtC) family protein
MHLSEEILKLLLAILVGALIGAEREFRHRAAGFRTIIFITLGATLFTQLSLRLGGDTSPVRIAAHMVTGVGFLCAGVIMVEGAKVIGLTTAATIWLSAALGMGIGGGYYLVTLTATAAALLILIIFPYLEERIYNIRSMRTYEVTLNQGSERMVQLSSIFERCELRVKGPKVMKTDGQLVGIFDVYGSPACHFKAVDQLLSDPEVRELTY